MSGHDGEEDPINALYYEYYEIRQNKQFKQNKKRAEKNNEVSKKEETEKEETEKEETKTEKEETEKEETKKEETKREETKREETKREETKTEKEETKEDFASLARRGCTRESECYRWHNAWRAIMFDIIRTTSIPPTISSTSPLSPSSKHQDDPEKQALLLSLRSIVNDFTATAVKYGKIIVFYFLTYSSIQSNETVCK